MTLTVNQWFDNAIRYSRKLIPELLGTWKQMNIWFCPWRPYDHCFVEKLDYGDKGKPISWGKLLEKEKSSKSQEKEKSSCLDHPPPPLLKPEKRKTGRFLMSALFSGWRKVIVHYAHANLSCFSHYQPLKCNGSQQHRSPIQIVPGSPAE